MNLDALVDYRWVFCLYNYALGRPFITEGDESARNVQCEVLVMYGEKDLIVPKITMNQYSEYLGDKAKLVEVKGAGHLLIGAYDEEIIENVRELFHL